MGKWLREAVLGPIDFDGDSVTVRACRLSVGDMQKLMPYMQQEKDGSVLLTMNDSIGLIKEAGEILPGVVKSIDGMTDGEGKTITADRYCGELINEFYFMEFTAKIVGELCAASIVNSGEEKNLDTPSSDSLRGPEETQSLLAGVK